MTNTIEIVENENHNKIMQALDWCYEKSIDGLPRTPTAIELANDYLTKHYNTENAVNSLIKWQCAKCGTSGFISGLGGLITLPVAIPANLSSVLYVQMRMTAAIAHIGGYDLKSDQVKTIVYICMCGNSGKDIMKHAGVRMGKQFTKSAISKISGKTITKINQKVGFRLLTKFGEKGVINLGKTIPLIGGFVGGAFDVSSTKIIGNVAKKQFIG